MTKICRLKFYPQKFSAPALCFADCRSRRHTKKKVIFLFPSFQNDSHISYRKEGKYQIVDFETIVIYHFELKILFVFSAYVISEKITKFKKSSIFAAVISKRISYLISKWWTQREQTLAFFCLFAFQSAGRDLSTVRSTVGLLFTNTGSSATILSAEEKCFEQTIYLNGNLFQLVVTV